MADAVVRLAVPSSGPPGVVGATPGAGGQAAALLGAMGPAGRLLGIDRDPEALAIAARRLQEFGDRARVVQGNFEDLGEIVTEHGWGTTDAVVYDFGVSSIDRKSTRLN